MKKITIKTYLSKEELSTLDEFSQTLSMSFNEYLSMCMRIGHAVNVAHVEELSKKDEAANGN